MLLYLFCYMNTNCLCWILKRQYFIFRMKIKDKVKYKIKYNLIANMLILIDCPNMN